MSATYSILDLPTQTTPSPNTQEPPKETLEYTTLDTHHTTTTPYTCVGTILRSHLLSRDPTTIREQHAVEATETNPATYNKHVSHMKSLKPSGRRRYYERLDWEKCDGCYRLDTVFKRMVKGVRKRGLGEDKEEGNDRNSKRKRGEGKGDAVKKMKLLHNRSEMPKGVATEPLCDAYRC